VGLGRIGAHVADIARAFGMRVIAHDPFLPEEHARQLDIELRSLDDLLASADVITLHLPLTDETRHLLGRERIRRMKTGAVVINTARGALVDQDALLEALEEGCIAGAALDVFEPEPLPEESPLRKSGRLILTPHLAASTSEAQERVAQEICAAVRDALRTGSVGGAINLPGLSREVLARLRGLLELSRRIGRLAVGIACGGVRAVEVAYGGTDEVAPRPAMLAALEGVLAAMGVSPVSMVNAAVLAKERGVSVSRRAGHAAHGFETTVGVTLETADRKVSVMGALVGEHTGRVIRIDDFEVDIPADGYILVLRNRDVPGVIGRVGGLLGEAKINIASYHQSRLETSGSEALAAIVVDEAPPPTVLRQLEALPDVLEVRFAEVNGEARRH
jgi:D-3-phosphoglycerate dehydrogenase